MTAARRFRLIVGISGATGIALGVRALELARAAGAETHLVVTRPADRTRAYEADLSAAQLRPLADFTHAINNIGAAIASGSFETDAMLVAPCSARTLSAIAYGAGDNLLARLADVTLKKRRRLVLLMRERHSRWRICGRWSREPKWASICRTLATALSMARSRAASSPPSYTTCWDTIRPPN